MMVGFPSTRFWVSLVVCGMIMWTYSRMKTFHFSSANIFLSQYVTCWCQTSLCKQHIFLASRVMGVLSAGALSLLVVVTWGKWRHLVIFLWICFQETAYISPHMSETKLDSHFSSQGSWGQLLCWQKQSEDDGFKIKEENSFYSSKHCLICAEFCRFDQIC